MDWRKHIYSPSCLPNGMIGHDTEEGKKLEEFSFINKKCIERAVKQINHTFCGPASLAIAINSINAMKLVKISNDWLTENDIDTVQKRSLVNPYNIKTNGLTLPQLGNVSRLLGFEPKIYFVVIKESNLSDFKIDETVNIGEVYFLKNIDEFRDLLKTQLNLPFTCLIANYYMEELGYKKLRGHFSPIAAYNQSEDMFLIMDTWITTPPAWVKTDDLYRAHATVDTDSALPRGILKLAYMSQ